MFRKILIANRGEIAVRVLRACQEMGIRTVAIYSEVDRAALHVSMADEAYCVGPAQASESYLSIKRVLAVARQCGAEAIHPGYGFLSENAAFARACEEAGIKFIGPKSSAIEAMGSKTRARQAMAAAGVPFVPGSAHGLSLEQARVVADEIGYPVMLKAAAGGGGRGMRVVRNAAELAGSFHAAASEAQRAFGDGELYLEKLIAQPRHIEMQVLADEHGRTLWLGERECSVQRRHQKVLEEAPSPFLTPETRAQMGEAAVRVAQAVGYTNAGTVEFLADQEGNFFFLEMNTRLQVEHPVTELVTGLDLVQLQIRIAGGEPLPFTQNQLKWRGHAMECRIYAEDADNAFLPSPGVISLLVTSSGPGIRLDSGVYEGWRVPLEYDPLLMKLIAFGGTRAETIARLERALNEFVVGGIKTNLPLYRQILADPSFRAGRLDTGFLDRLLAKPKPPEVSLPQEQGLVAGIAAALFAATDPGPMNGLAAPKETAAARPSAWKRAGRLESIRGRG